MAKDSTLKFITGNKGKVREIREILKPLKVKQVDIDLDEIQELDPYKIIRHKLNEAFKHHNSNFFIEDTGTCYAALKNKLPGTLAKWFLEVLGVKGLYQLSRKFGSNKAEMTTIIAYAKSRSKVFFFEGRTKGKILSPRGANGFGLDAIFSPRGSNLTQAQMSQEQKSATSSRSKAAAKLKQFLIKDGKRSKTKRAGKGS